MVVTRLDSILTKYHTIGVKLMYSDFILDTLAPKVDPANKLLVTMNQAEKDLDLYQDLHTIDICFDYTVIQLFSLLEAHKDLTAHLTPERQKLEDSLSDAWKIVEAQNSRICIWRNNFIAHGKSFVKDGSFPIISDMESDLPKAQTYLLRASKAAIIYISGFLRNTPEYLDVINEYESGYANTEIPCPQYRKIDVDSVLKSIKGSLEKNGFESDLITKL